MHIAVATDAAYLPWCATTILSALRATTMRPVHVHVLEGGDIDRADLERLLEMIDREGAEGTALAVDEARIEHLPTKGPDLGGRVSWYRVLLPDLLPDVRRVLYLDADLLVVAPLDDLWAADLAGAPLGAVRNVVEPTMREHVHELGLVDHRDYFNAGVLVIELDRWRADAEAARIDEFVAARGATPWFDQDALNVTFAGRWHALDPRWNAQNSMWFWRDLAVETFGAAAVDDATSSPGILHFEGPSIVKPWHYLCPHPHTARYREVLRSTPWGRVPLTGRTPVNRALRLLPSRHRLNAYARVQQRRAAP
jgi:lipopolysaccharide biosynthesis glycosyltransferase